MIIIDITQLEKMYQLDYYSCMMHRHCLLSYRTIVRQASICMYAPTSLFAKRSMLTVEIFNSTYIHQTESIGTLNMISFFNKVVNC